ncbi:MAG: hypothetical protein A2Y82_00820 [Candidatus Buchananbacteria bacterium RBG_13_36_9]|uniref:Uncharacterized protein n=1 Tax=Candidatus Buchananbacteria bacterium RBG_13_36_9 TaxID=1797530 RepID=A0A1G1XMX1_9BACT|nr:MAG: hypothetical protein A2Y82_00820 [Candidatus Buchananbacteria bacterium RBG_13_36_9]
MTEKIFKPEKKPDIEDTFSDLEFLLNFESDHGYPEGNIPKIEKAFNNLRKLLPAASLEEKKKALLYARESYFPGNPKNLNQEIIGLYVESGQLGIDQLAAELIEVQKEKLKDQFNDETEAGHTIWRIVELARELVPKADNINAQPLIEGSVKLLLRDDYEEITYIFQDLLDYFAAIGEPAAEPLITAMEKNYNTDSKSARKIANLVTILKNVLINSNVKEQTKELASQQLVKFLNKYDRLFTFTLQVEECLADIGEAAIESLIKSLSEVEDDNIRKYADVFSKMAENVKSEKLFEAVPIFESKLKNKNVSAYQVQRIEEIIKQLKEVRAGIKKKAA